MTDEFHKHFKIWGARESNELVGYYAKSKGWVASLYRLYPATETPLFHPKRHGWKIHDKYNPHLSPSRLFPTLKQAKGHLVEIDKIVQEKSRKRRRR